MTAASGRIPAAQLGRVLLPGFVAAGTGALVFTGVAGWRGLHQTNLALPPLPPYESVRIADVGWSLLLAAAIAIVVVTLRHAGDVVAVQAGRGRRRVPVLVVAGVPVGLLAVGFRAIADRPVDLVLFLRPGGAARRRGRGIGGHLGAARRGERTRLGTFTRRRVPRWTGVSSPGDRVAVAMAAANVLPGFETTPAVATGIAAGTAALLGVPFTAVLLATVLVGSSAFDVAPIAVLAAAMGWLVASALPSPEDRLAAAPEQSPAASPV